MAKKKINKGKQVKFRGKLYNPDHFNNRDLSWLDFNFRVLNEALDKRTLLLERLRFIDIFRSNLDEFFMKRIGSLQLRIESRSSRKFIDGIEHLELYQKMREKIEGHLYTLDELFSFDILPRLQDEGIQLLSWNELGPNEKTSMKRYFKQNIFPILTPLAVDSGHPFPFLSNLSKSIALCIRKPKGKKKHFARVKIPYDLPQWIALTPNRDFSHRFINIEEVISNNIEQLFEGMSVESMMIFRVTRNAIIEDDDEDIEDLMEVVEEGLKERKFAPVVRLEYEDGADPWLVNFLAKELEIGDDKLYPIHSYLSYTNFSSLLDLPLPHLKHVSFKGKAHPSFSKKDIFKEIAKKDILLHFPYDNYSDSLELFLQAAVCDPKVKAIKMTLYRTDEDGRLIDLLIQAAENKKQVACIVELKARFDEERNIKWAQTLEDAGIHVSYGVANYKTHSKMVMVIRQENKKLKTYVNIGTGNYNSQTSRLYTDLSFFTCDKRICAESLYVFNYLTGRSLKGSYRNLLVAPFNMHKKFIWLINNEVKNAKAGKPSAIVAKMNSLEDPEVIENLYRASQAGVKVHLIVRGFCSIKAQIPELSKNIYVYSLVGRLLEHSRIYFFRNGQDHYEDGQFFIGSADWMHRNLFDRIEVITPIIEKSLRKQIWEILKISMKDNRHVWEMRENGVYEQRTPAHKANEINGQETFIERTKDAVTPHKTRRR